MSTSPLTFETRTAPIVILFDSFGPYHVARLRAAQAHIPLVGVEIGSRSDDYPWFDSTGADFPLVRLFEGRASGTIAPQYVRAALFAQLDAIRPSVVAIPGWGTLAALAALEWCARRQCPAVMMCDSTTADARRRSAVEALKRAIVASCGAGFVSGSRSLAYLERLGLPRPRIAIGYDVVDNAHFADGAAAARVDRAATQTALGLPESYILSIGRLIEKKNLPGLLRGYALYRMMIGEDALPLVIGGGGPLEADLRALAEALGLADTVRFAGHIGYADLPAYYGLARCFALVSHVEQWGLVINEAIAGGLPVLASSACGAASDLVVPGENGLVCDSDDPAAIARALADLCHTTDFDALSYRSREIAAAWDLPRFVSGLTRAAAIAIAQRRAPRLLPVLLARLLLRVQARRQRLRPGQ